MTPDRQAEILIFNTAIALNPGDARARYLDEACAGDPERRRRIEALIQAYESSPEFLDTNPGTGNVTAAIHAPISEDVGATIGRYKLLQKIGEGGFGVVYMAEQRDPVKRRVALKIIKLGMDTKQVVARFEAERQALALMDHPNIAKVLDGGATDTGRPYFVMELVHGVPITQFCDEHQLTTQARLQLFVQVCQALQHAHHKGIIHRDVKPTNILVTMHDDRPVPKVIDFGIAKATQQELTEKTLFTQFRQFIGTPAYMSPEQAQWTDIDIDTRSDIYSLGVLLYELLTGKTPIDTRELLNAGYDEICRRIREQEPPLPSTRISTMADVERGNVAKQRRADPRKLGTLLRGDLDWIVMKALEKDRARRYETANDFARDIQRFLSHEPVTAAPPSAVYRFQRFTRRHKTAMAVATLIVTLLITGTAVSSWLAVRATRARASAEKESEQARLARIAEAEQRTLAETNAAVAKALLIEARHEEGKTLLASAQRLREEKNLFAANMTAARALGFAGFGRPTNDAAFATHYPVLLKPGSAEETQAKLFIAREPDFAPLWHSTIGRHHPNPLGTDFHRTGHTILWQLAFTTNRTALLSKLVSGIRYWDIQDGRLLGEFPDESYSAISPSGDFIVSNDGRYFSLRKPGTGEVLCRLEGMPGAIFSVAAQPAAGLVALGLGAYRDPVRVETSGTNEIRLLNVLSGARISTITNLTHPPGAVALDPSGQWLAYATTNSTNSTIHICQVATGTETRRLAGHQGQVRTLAFSASGNLLASAGSDHKIQLWSTDNWSARSTLTGHTNTVHSLLFHPTKPLLFSGAADHTVRVWDTEGSQLQRTLNGHDNVVRALAVDATGTRLASGCANGVVLLWDLANYQPQFVPPSHADGISSVRISPDGSTIASGSYDRTVRLWAAHSGRLIATLRGHTAPVHSVDFSPDGLLLASLDARAIVIIWNLERNERVHTLDPGEPTPDRLIWSLGRTVLFHPDGQRLASRKGPTPILWDVQSGKKLMEFERLSGNIHVLAWDRSGSLLAASGWQGMCLWRIPNPTPYLKLDNPNMVHALEFVPDGTQIIRTSSAGIEFLNAASGNLQTTLTSSTAMGSLDILLNPSASLVAVTGQRGAIELWHLPSRAQVAKLLGHDRQVTSLDIAPDDSFLVSGSLDGALVLWDLKLDAAKFESNSKWNMMSAGKFWLTFDPTGRKLITTLDQGHFEVRDVQTSELLAFHGPFLPYGDFLWWDAAGNETIFTGSNTGEISRWDPLTGTALHKLNTDKGPIHHLAFEPNRSILATLYADRSIDIWDTQNWTRKRSWNLGASPDQLRFLPDGTRLAVTSKSKTIEFWNVDTGALDHDLRIENGTVSECAFSRTGQKMVTGGDKLRIWDLPNRRIDFQTEISSDVIFSSPAISPDESMFAVAKQHRITHTRFGANIVVELRDLESGRVIHEFPGHPQSGNPTVAFSPNGETLAFGWFTSQWSLDWTIRLFNLKSALNQNLDLASYAPQFQWTANPPALALRTATSNLVAGPPNLPVRPGKPGAALRIYQDAPPDRERQLFWRAYAAENWSAAQVLVQKLKKLEQAPYEQTALTRMLVKQARVARGNGLTNLAARYADSAAFVSPADLEALTLSAELALAQARHDRAVEASRELVRLYPKSAQSWRISADVFAATEQNERALNEYQTAIQLAKDVDPTEWRLSLRHRARLLHKLGRTSEARSDQLQALAIPERDPNLSTNQLDLTLYYNAALDEDLPEVRPVLALTFTKEHAPRKGNNLKEFLAARAQPMGGVSFDARGLIHLRPGDAGLHQYPRSVQGIPVNRPIKRLHILHAAAYEDSDRSYSAVKTPKIAEYVLNYTDGSSHVFPVENEAHIYSWIYNTWEPDQVNAVKKLGSVWEGKNEFITHVPLRLALFKTTWENPHPNKTLASIDLVGTHNFAAPFVLGITVE